MIPAILVALLISAAIGFANGFITRALKVPSFVTTLGTLILVIGILLITSHAYPAPILEPATGAIQRWLGEATGRS